MSQGFCNLFCFQLRRTLPLGICITFSSAPATRSSHLKDLRWLIPQHNHQDSGGTSAVFLLVALQSLWHLLRNILCLKHNPGKSGTLFLFTAASQDARTCRKTVFDEHVRKPFTFPGWLDFSFFFLTSISSFLSINQLLSNRRAGSTDSVSRENGSSVYLLSFLLYLSYPGPFPPHTHAPETPAKRANIIKGNDFRTNNCTCSYNM